MHFCNSFVLYDSFSAFNIIPRIHLLTYFIINGEREKKEKRGEREKSEKRGKEGKEGKERKEGWEGNKEGLL